jgi:hypothetical protein
MSLLDTLSLDDLAVYRFLLYGLFGAHLEIPRFIWSGCS